jgi:hypothetical protein
MITTIFGRPTALARMASPPVSGPLTETLGCVGAGSGEQAAADIAADIMKPRESPKAATTNDAGANRPVSRMCLIINLLCAYSSVFAAPD